MAATRKPKAASASVARGQCLCGAVEIEIGVPARWAWHDHSATSRRAHGAAYATYVGAYRSRFRILKGEDNISRYEETPGGRRRSFCKTCGSPLLYERPHAKTMVNVPRALFATRTGREPLYHIAVDDMQEWTYRGEALRPLKGFPGVVWTGPQRKKRAPQRDALFD
jgi:hypothetical protein